MLAKIAWIRSLPNSSTRWPVGIAGASLRASATFLQKLPTSHQGVRFLVW